ncbi:uncharacterized protein LOC111602378 [Drosophila hydei]|uniref:Uncharacterized protein LOC111602378 n=1 Tax=Drosophila hydei TaxID=7224 RepID=A0A6J1MDT9_DROHY|nr:uncharacterized protein LOC111602378 [Drosophila hydei]
MVLGPIELICYYVVQPIIDFLDKLLISGHYIAFYIGISVFGVLLGIVMGIVSVIWYKYVNREEPKKIHKIPLVKDEGQLKAHDMQKQQ